MKFVKGQSAHNAVDLTSRCFGRWTVLQKSVRDRYYACRCECGIEREVFGSSLTNGTSTSCGCLGWVMLPKQRAKHGHARQGSSRRVEYETWARVISRCENPQSPAFKDYGGRGITVCDRWRNDYFTFFQDMGPRPGPGYSIERIDVNGHYEPSNCCWATAREQARNRRSSRLITINGATKTLVEWAEIAGVTPGTISRRVVDGWTDDRLLSPQQKPGPSRLEVH